MAKLHMGRLLFSRHAGGPGGTGHSGFIQQNQQACRIALIE